MATLNINGMILLKFLASILLSGVKFFNVQIPFVMGFIEREDKTRNKIIMYALASITIAVRFSWMVSLRFIVTAILFSSIIRVLNTLNFRRNNDTGIYLLVSVTFIDLIWCSFDGILVYDVIIASIKGISALLGYVLFGRVSGLNKNMEDKDFLYTIATIGLLLSGLGDISIFSINIRSVLGAYVVLMLAYTNGVKYSTMTGLILGTMNEITNPSMGVSIISFTLGGFCAGLLKNRGKMAQVWGFLLGNSILAYYITGYNSLILKYFEITIASSLFYVSCKKKVDELIIVTPELVSLPVVNNLALEKLEESSDSMFSVSTLIDEFEVTADEELDIFDEIKEDVCFSCDSYEDCWDKRYDETSDEIFNVIERLEDNEKIDEKDFLSMNSCENSKDILDRITSKYEDFKVSKKEDPFSVLKQCVSNQFKGFSQYITQMKENIYEDTNQKVEEKIINAFSKENITIDKLNVNIDDKNCQVSLKMQEGLPKVGFLLIANNILSKVLNRRMVISDEKRDVMIFREKRPLCISSEVVSKKADNAAIIGDSYKIEDSTEDKFMAILSDGMGTGYEASKMSSALVDMFAEMSKTGINVGTITNMINSFMGYISKTEKIVTLDAMSVDLLTGDCDFLKIGSAPSFIIRGKNVDIVSCDTLPLGIFDSVEFFERNYHLEVNDVVVVVSDGVIDSKRNVINKEFWVSGFLRNLDISEPKIIAEELLEKTIENYNGEVKDDITIIVSRVEERKD